MHVFGFIIKLTPIIGTLLITIEAWIGFLITRRKLNVPEKTFLRYISPILWGLDIAGLLGLIIIIGALPLLGGVVIRLLIQIYFTWGKQFVDNVVQKNQTQNQNTVIASTMQAQNEIEQSKQISLSQNNEVAQIEQEYLNLKNEEEKRKRLTELKNQSKDNLVAQVAYNRLTNDKDKQPQNQNQNSIQSKKPVPEGAQQTPKTLRPEKTPESITKARLERAQEVRKQGQEASIQRQTQPNNLIGEKIAEQAKEVVTKKETESQNKLKDLIKSTLTQKLNE